MFQKIQKRINFTLKVILKYNTFIINKKIINILLNNLGLVEKFVTTFEDIEHLLY